MNINKLSLEFYHTAIAINIHKCYDQLQTGNKASFLRALMESDSPENLKSLLRGFSGESVRVVMTPHL